MNNKKGFLAFIIEVFVVIFLLFCVFIILCESSEFANCISCFSIGFIICLYISMIFDDICSCIKFWKNRNSPPSGEDKK